MAIEILSIEDDGSCEKVAADLNKILRFQGFSVSRRTTICFETIEIEQEISRAWLRSSIVMVLGSASSYETVASFFSVVPEQLSPSVFKFSDNHKLLFFFSDPIGKISLKEVFPFLKTKDFFGRCSLCLLQPKEVSPFLSQIESQGVQIKIESSFGLLHLTFLSDRPVESFIDQVAKKFPSYFLNHETLEQALQIEMTQRKKTLGLAESCTGGAIAARLVAVPGASLFFSGSIVAYSNDWKQRFLALKRDALVQHGAVSRETVEQMVLSLFAETNVDYAVAVSGMVGPSSVSEKKGIGTIYIAVGKRGEKIDAGRIMGPSERMQGIELTLQTALGALWRRVVHNAFTLS